jgi:hypothetical protein
MRPLRHGRARRRSHPRTEARPGRTLEMMSACNPDRLPARSSPGSGSAATSATWARRRDQAAAARDRVDGAAGALGWAVMAPSDKYHRLCVCARFVLGFPMPADYILSDILPSATAQLRPIDWV